VAIISTIAITRRMRRNLIDLRFCPATGYAGLDTMRPAPAVRSLAMEHQLA
jgi:hypothetical protein